MAEKRMISSKITDHDNFTTLPATAQALYLHLILSADDDGFCAQANSAMLKAHAKKKDLDELVKRRYLIRFDSGVYAVKHWKMQNSIRPDRYHETEYKEEKARLFLKPNGSYTTTECQPQGRPCDAKPAANPQPSDAQIAANPQPSDNNPQPQYLGSGLGLGLDLKSDECITRARAKEEETAEHNDPEDGDGFDTFWSEYPTKSGDIRQAYFEYLGVIQSGVDPKTLLDAVKWQREVKEPRYMGSAEKWLRNRGWTEKKTEPRQKKQKSYTSASDYVAPGADATLEEITSVYDKI